MRSASSATRSSKSGLRLLLCKRLTRNWNVPQLKLPSLGSPSAMHCCTRGSCQRQSHDLLRGAAKRQARERRTPTHKIQMGRYRWYVLRPLQREPFRSDSKNGSAMGGALAGVKTCNDTDLVVAANSIELSGTIKW